ncbi:MAG: type II toxin-antitoxin system VapC family toxin [Chloroflexaceae bacterium]|jgi:tRNA(fMet)-specific endonuclease VapC|nr:type II toxin-antitoxin system VapC family toxin [Chloroflexaceae bacterium]
MIFLLDTDHVSLDQCGHPLVRQRVQQAGPTNICISVITVEEQMRGWLAAIRVANTSEARVLAYQRFRMAFEYLSSFTVYDFTTNLDTQVSTFRSQGIRVGTQDLRIATVALAHGATLVTRNRTHFQAIPGLLLVDWSQS